MEMTNLFRAIYTVGGNALVQLSRMVLEKGRLRRPERFLQLLCMVHFRRKCTMHNNCKRDAAEALPLPVRDYCPTDLQVTARGKEGEGGELWHNKDWMPQKSR